jgi:hypothetical protein
LVVAEEPAGRLSDVARVGVLGREDDERSSELLMERGDQKRERRLRDSGTRIGKLLEERAETLALGELANERMKDGWDRPQRLTLARNPFRPRGRRRSP